MFILVILYKQEVIDYLLKFMDIFLIKKLNFFDEINIKLYVVLVFSF